MMDKSSDPAAGLAAGQLSTGELAQQLYEQVSALARDELRLARLEMTRKGKEAGVGTGLIGAGGLTALYGVACLLAAAVLGLSHVLTGWLAAFVVGAALFAVSGAAALAGRARLGRAVPPAPQQAAEEVKADIREIKERAHP